jgi:hypothetical protein
MAMQGLATVTFGEDSGAAVIGQVAVAAVKAQPGMEVLAVTAVKKGTPETLGVFKIAGQSLQLGGR